MSDEILIQEIAVALADAYDEGLKEAADTIEALRAENARLREALKNARADARKEGAEIAFAYNGMPRSEIAQAFARAARVETECSITQQLQEKMKWIM